MTDAPKPWETESWIAFDSDDDGDDFGIYRSDVVTNEGGTMARDYVLDRGMLPEDARLAAAAPEMARLLLSLEWAGWNQEGDDPADACPACYQGPPRTITKPARRIDAYTRIEASQETLGGHRHDCALIGVLRKAGVLPTP